MTVPTVVFQVTALGRNARTIDETVRSVLYWTRNTPRLAFRYLVWAVIEPDGERSAPATYEALRRVGVELLVVPPGYRTARGASGKARALEYAPAERRRRGLSGPTTWVYHQDEETSVGEDTLLGIDEFARGDRGAVGTGIILYPIDWSGRPSHVQEVVRSFDDFRVLDSMTLPGNPTTGFHGSHILVRADVEESVGWDHPGYSPAEDLLFEMRVRARYGNVFGVLPGFAYEKAAFSLRDQLRQRRRWVHGVLHVLAMPRGAQPGRRGRIAYGAVCWFSALPSIVVLALGLVLPFGPVLLVTGLFTGFIWASMVLGYLEGYRLHREYLPARIGPVRFFAGGLAGALVDVLAPWYALLSRPSPNDFIPKDRPRADGARPRPEARVVASGTGQI